MWEHLARNNIRFRNYGEGFEFPGVEEDEDEHPTGAREVVNMPMPKVLYDNTCREFPIFNMNIPDQYRAHWFMKEVEELFLRGKQPFPPFLNIALCSDHGSDPNPARGSRSRADRWDNRLVAASAVALPPPCAVCRA